MYMLELCDEYLWQVFVESTEILRHVEGVNKRQKVAEAHI